MFVYCLEVDECSLEVLLSGDLDIEGTEVMEYELVPNLLHSKKVNINFKDVAFVDSTGMGLLINLVQTLTEQDIQITISNVRSEIMEVFDLLQLPQIIGEELFINN
ncbi:MULTISPECIES: STAS domain-containing protein [Bacillus]|uniref:STAS domain-containing protein n=1 Tax=Bacillus TaxID=1386 RepID=UPI000BB95C2E|nr:MULTISPECIES: STAS domain-containing protein [Bacillus]